MYKRGYIDDLPRQVKTAAGQGNLGDLYLMTKKLTGKFQQTDKPVKAKNGNPLTTTKEQLKRWAEHFRELLNRPTPDPPPDIPPADRTARQLRQTLKGIMALRNAKAAGPNEIPRSHQSRHRDSCQYTIQCLQHNLGEGGGIGPVSNDSFQRQRLQQLLRDHAPVNAKQGSQQGSTGEDERGYRPKAPRPAGRLP